MIPILYESNETQFTSNGLGRLRDCISCRPVEERNSIFEVDFEYPVDGAHFDDIIPGRIIYATYDDTKIPQPFDIVGYTKPLNGIVTFHAEHISYRQTKLTCYGSNINSISEAFQLFGTAQPENPFSYDADFTSNAFMAAADTTPRSVRQMIGGVEGSLLDACGGELLWDRFQVHLKKNRGVKRDFTIRYGVNLLDYNEDADYSGVYSSCIPFWHGQDSTGNEITVIGSRVDYNGASYNGRNDCVPLDLTEKFESQPTSAQLESMATSVMNLKRPNLPSKNIKVDFLRLQDMSGYEQFESLLQCNLCDTITVVFPRYNMEGDFKIVRTVYDTLTERYVEMELGALSTTLAEALGISTTPTPDRINENFYVDSDGNITSNGNITVEGHTSPIGTVLTGTRETSAGTSDTTYTTAAHIDLTAGTWNIDAFNSFNGGTAGTRRVLITDNADGTTDAGRGSGTGYAPANTQIVVRSSLNVTITEDTTFYMRIKSSVSLNSPYGNLTAVRIA